MRTWLIMCVASLAANDVWAQVAPVAGMTNRSVPRTDMGIGTANIGSRAGMQRSTPTVQRSYGSYYGQNNSTAFGRTITVAPMAASTIGQPLVNPNQPTVFQDNGTQPTMFRNSLSPSRNVGSFSGQGFGELSISPAVGLGNINIQARQIAQTPAPVQTRQAAQISAPVQIAQPRQPSAPFNVPSTFNAFQRRPF
ncbi:MAG TPA: hypothetical protein VHC22_32795 [Pirellulales bacterium]|nr:hypothetical protein [Pirellulales bacterium]